MRARAQVLRDSFLGTMFGLGAFPNDDSRVDEIGLLGERGLIAEYPALTVLLIRNPALAYGNLNSFLRHSSYLIPLSNEDLGLGRSLYGQPFESILQFSCYPKHLSNNKDSLNSLKIRLLGGQSPKIIHENSKLI